MKIRNGFVSNSSSSSFVIYKRQISARQLQEIYDHTDVAEDEAWSIEEDKIRVYGRTWMDNFDMGEYLVEHVGVKPEDIHWKGTYY